ncbi:MAG: PAS domain-containing protein [Deltaproteobacteria bacterium]|nr:PAS domain-containing protein [Deltaproteobacteria bacterium]
MTVESPTGSRPQPGRPRTALTSRLIVFVAVFSFGPLLVSNLWGYLNTSRITAEAVERNAANVAALEAAQTYDFVRSRHDFVGSLVAGNEHLLALLQASPSSPLPARSALMKKHLLAKAQETRGVEDLQVLSPRGFLLAATSKEHAPGLDLSRTTCFEKGRSVVSIAGFEYGGPEPVLVTAAPIRDSGGNVHGTVCAKFRFEIQRELIAARETRTTNAMLTLIDDAGRIVAGSFHDALAAPYGHVFRPGRAPTFAGRREPWIGTYLLSSGEPAIVAFAPVRELGWGIVVEIPHRDAFLMLARLKNQAILFGVVFAVLLLAAIFLISKTLTRPLRLLADTAHQLASGALGARVDALSGPREVATLASAFNEMSRALKASHEHLEARIEERTQELRKSQEFTEHLFNSIDQRVIVVDRDHRILRANATTLRLYGRDVVGQKCHDLFEGSDARCDHCPIDRVFETSVPAFAERSQRVGERQEIVRLDGFPVRSSDGAVASVIEIARIVTAEKRFEAQLMHQEKMAAFGLLAAGIAHEIGNPLASIASQLHVTRDNPTPARTEETLAVVEKSVQRIAGLLRDLVDFARRKRDDVVLVDVNRVVDDVTRLISHDPRARQVRFEKRLCVGGAAVMAREDDLVQVLLNLGINALDAMPAGGVVLVETAVEDSWVTIRVSDAGAGVAPDLRERIFEPFFTTKKSGRGTGLGLFVSRGIVEGLGGAIGLADASGAGASFFVKLPRGRMIE